MSALQAKMHIVMYAKRIAQLTGAGALALMMAVCNASAQLKATADHERQTAIAYEQQGQLAEAETAWRSVLKAHPADAEAYAHLGLLEARQEHYKEAVPLYRKALELNPSMPGLRMNLGLSQFKSGALKDAGDTFTLLLKTEP